MIGGIGASLQWFVSLTHAMQPELTTTNTPGGSPSPHPSQNTPIPLERDTRATLSIDDIVLIAGGSLVCLLVLFFLGLAARSLHRAKEEARPPQSTGAGRTAHVVDHSYGSFLT